MTARTAAGSTSPWLMIVTVWLTLGVAFGFMFSFSVFLVPLLEEFGWSRGLAAGAFSLSAIMQGVLSPVVGTFVDRVGPRRVILTGAVVIGVSCLLSSQITQVWHLYVVTGVFTAVGVCAVGFVPSGALVAQWFAHRKASMMGIVFSGMGVGVLVVGPLAQWLISGYGWRRAYMVLGAGALVGLVPLVWVGVRDRVRLPAHQPRGPATAEAGMEVREALVTPAFWALFFAYVCTPLAVFTVVTHQVAFAVDHGFPRLFVAWIFGLAGLMSIFGRIIFGIGADYIGRAWSATISYGCTAAGILALLSIETSQHPAGLYVYALLFGLGFGAR
ncbi:MAG TPA: MFS transporter, partial [Candidatus Limnocylindria bacterium]|nr:MFS transporter [Candidatus Limnocylindria bacterium]